MAYSVNGGQPRCRRAIPNFGHYPLSLALRSGPNLAVSGVCEDIDGKAESGGQLTAQPAAGSLAAADFRYRRLGY